MRGALLTLLALAACVEASPSPVPPQVLNIPVIAAGGLYRARVAPSVAGVAGFVEVTKGATDAASARKAAAAACRMLGRSWQEAAVLDASAAPYTFAEACL